MSDHEEKDAGQRAIPEAGLFGRIIAKLSALFSLAIVSSAAILIFEVAMRYLFNSPTIWAHETVIFLTATTFLFGGLYCASTNKHIRVVLIYDALSPELRRVFNVAISIACALASALFSWAGWLVVKRAIWTPAGDFRLETSGSAWNPPTPGLLKLFLLGILILMCLQFAILAVNYAKKK
ncbi:Tripartite ATP-independent periplasmic transporter, DctQ component [Pseudovibrio sp. W64]|uniref:TRAP transporter small permease subunit n=1 Tax=unclassified Pseudovibrio TaxID=2627060 RepID=UPI0007AE8293|nr:MULTISPECIES: TRAP transporter small permease [unclassified Pseudovibrio]KZK78199.1 Tripartite ATP-independent periplasmic transporter, DctQ component [Pseudovibrio sp. W64]KZK84586.1 Tripartite ATP-independent periplasmic transporter, DctQ component [Pseudovibrio sp. Ad13]KZK90334.1 Tripartite ATP-independent periplasmic transporter, DctQ component [Pseudovibrio sp. Ad46]KZK92944.1 Tripartite ATP-independent periplasmic transporter, DctQ component [Pseudovibrio sp. Ad5]KZK98637.1 Tripartit